MAMIITSLGWSKWVYERVLNIERIVIFFNLLLSFSFYLRTELLYSDYEISFLAFFDSNFLTYYGPEHDSRF